MKRLVSSAPQCGQAMRKMILALTIYLTHALAPPFTPPFTPPSVTEAAAKFIKLGVSAAPRGSQTVNRRKRKRVRRTVHRKPKTVWVLPDKVELLTPEQAERELRWPGWVTWF